MAAAKKTYTRLTPLCGKTGAYYSLWLAEDHVLHVSSTGYTDNYQRFYLRDLRGVFVQRTETHRAIAILLGVILLVMGGSAYFGSKNLWVTAAASFLPAFLLVWNWWRGPSCRMYFCTGLQTARIHAAPRLKIARRALALLTPPVLAAQRDVLATTSATTPPIPPLPPPPAPEAP